MRCNLCGHEEPCPPPGAVSAPLCPACGSRPEDRELQWFLSEKAPLPENPRILDVGPAPARLAHASALFPRARYTAIDPIPRGAGRSLKPPHRFLVADVTRMTFSEQAFDVVLAPHVLAEVRSDYMAMWEIHRVLRNDGFAVLTEALYAGKTMRFGEWRGGDVPDAYSDRPLAWAYGDDFVERLEAAGFFVHRLDLRPLAGARATELGFRERAELILGFKFRVALRAFQGDL